MTVEEHLPSIQAQAWADSQFWFPGVHREVQWLPIGHYPLIHVCLGIGGEVGEVLNVVKKYNRGTLDWDQMVELVQPELADVMIYLCDLASAIGVDLAEATAAKRAVLIQRWGDPGAIV